MITLGTLEQMSEVNIEIVKLDDLVDIDDVSVDTSLPIEDRFLNYIDQIKNPYCFKLGKTRVKISFGKTEITLEEKLLNYFLNNKARG